MRQYNALQALFMSFYSKRLYRDVAMNWGGYALLYLLFLLFLAWIPFTVLFQMGLNALYHSHSEVITPQIPVMTIKNGVISTPEKRPYLIKDANGKEIIAIIDTSGTYKNVADSKAGLLITETEVITQPKPNEVRVDKLPTTLNTVVDPTTVNAFLKKYIGYLWILIFPTLVFVGFIYRLVQSLIYALFGKLFASIFQVPLTYGQVMQIVMVALTPVIVLSTIFDIFGVGFMYQGLFYFLLAMVYLIYGIKANKNVPPATSNPTL